MARRARIAAATVLLAGLWSGPTGAGALDEPHLDIVERSAADADAVATLTAPATEFDRPAAGEARPAGDASVPAREDRDAFSQPSANIGFERELDFARGNALFRRVWSPAGSGRPDSDGLGPLFNATSCQGCHVRDGRGKPPDDPAEAVTMVLRLSGPDPADGASPRPDPVYGGQLQHLGLPGIPAEGRPQVAYDEIAVPLSDGETAVLRRPTLSIAAPGYGPPDPGLMSSPRVAPQMIGLGLIEAVPAADILALADPDDRDGDGISGRPNLVWSEEFDITMLGRFGHKAGEPTLRQQAARALSIDMGISSPLFPAPWGDCTGVQTICRDAPDGRGDAGTEITAAGLDLVTFYSRNLAVPARRDAGDSQVLRGKAVFHAAGCASCHRPAFVTHRLADRPEQSFQLIWPYSDLLLHDMGEGLADHRPEAAASGREWRTAPLWGIGRAAGVSGHSLLLHDGRARSVLEAILWHGGEAQPHRDTVVRMPAADRAALIRFLGSL